MVLFLTLFCPSMELMMETFDCTFAAPHNAGAKKKTWNVLDDAAITFLQRLEVGFAPSDYLYLADNIVPLIYSASQMQYNLDVSFHARHDLVSLPGISSDSSLITSLLINKESNYG